jgi:hypothetical protein
MLTVCVSLTEFGIVLDHTNQNFHEFVVRFVVILQNKSYACRYCVAETCIVNCKV